MNDFTKEELEELLYALDCCHTTPVNVESPPLILKIQSMIDNYCSHSYMTGKHGIITCDDCGKIL